MISKNKGQVLLRNERRGEQRIQGSELGDMRENNNKRSRHQAIPPNCGSRSNIHSENSLSNNLAMETSSLLSTGGQQINKSNFISSGSTSQPEQAQPSPSDVMATLGNDTRKENKRFPSSKGY